MNFTAEQNKAIEAPGNTLVLAGAGSGKTRTLVERCARILLDPANPVSVRDILLVTFNEAAAAEVRERLRLRLEEETATNPRALEQLALLDLAPISTLHSFCFSLLREHFYTLDLDPAVGVLDAPEARMLFLQTIEELLSEHYAGEHPFSAALQEYLRSHLRGWAKPLIEFVRAVHEFTQTRPDPDRWFDLQLESLANPDCPHWHAWRSEALREWAHDWLPFLRSLGAENENAAHCAALFETALASEDPALATRILERDKTWPKGQKTRLKKPIEKLFAEAEFFHSLQPAPDSEDPLRQDWHWTRDSLHLLLTFARQFAERFATAKQERCVLDFHDLEQGALRLLWHGDSPSPIALECQRRFQAVFVDEYQDINAAQDRIIRALGANNRFLVGDNKQSIYRFRQADPSIFQGYLQAAARPSSGWEQASLAENFRSHQGILNFINPLFAWLMRPEVGGIAYDSRARLQFADLPERAHLKAKRRSRQVEFHLVFTDTEPEWADDDDDEGPAPRDLASEEREAKFVAARLRELKESGFALPAEGGGERPAEWRDMVVLLRAASGKIEAYCKAFEEAGVPLHTKQNAFYTTPEVLDLCSLLHLLDNPLQDTPLVAVLRSPLCGLTANELAEIRIRSRAFPFWRALREYRDFPEAPPGQEKVRRFLDRFDGWRQSHASASLSQRLDRILADTGYEDWVLSQPRGPQRHANIQQLLRVARRFDDIRGEGLYLFLRHIEDLQESIGDIEPAAAVHDNAVRLMTVHQSKGLEFPIVVAPDLGKLFNRLDQMNAVLLDEKYGLCAMIKPPGAGQRYPSLPLWLARRAQYRETLGEEIRLMYVAFTRAQNHLLLFGSATQSRAEKWRATAVERPLPHHLLKARGWLDWIGSWLTSENPRWLDSEHGTLSACTYRLHRESPPGRRPRVQGLLTFADPHFAGVNVPELERRLDFVYPHLPATREPAKTSVSRLRRRGLDLDEEARPVSFRATRSGDGRLRGVATHAFLEHLALEGPLDAAGLNAQAASLARAGILSQDDVALIDFDSLAAFWSGPTARDLLAQRAFLQRELAFTYKLTGANLARAGLADHLQIPEDEFVVLQGIADLVLLRPGEIWLLDFKTDQVDERESAATADAYRPQLALYALALSAIYDRPVTRQGLYFVHRRREEWL